MATAKEKAERRVQRLCVDCGSERTAPGNTLLRCAYCAEKGRAIDAAAVQPPRNIGSAGSCDDAWTAKTTRWEAA